MAEFKLPTETIELPSKGLIYPKDNPLSSGKIEMKYMTAKEEDILSNQSYIEKGIVIDKLLQSLIISDINYNDLIIGDKNAIMVAARILGYGKNYEFMYEGEKVTLDLTTLDNKEINEENFPQGQNNFSFKLPATDTDITFKILTHKDELNITRETEGLKKINKNNSSTLTTRLKHIITSVGGDSEPKSIREYVDKYMLAQDSRALRTHISDFQPDVDLSFFPSTGRDKKSLPIGLNFFWPDYE
tara:strand:- start:10749 stop:11480 length:732 start_codon:yes stop_codon:yes gene_type:complete